MIGSKYTRTCVKCKKEFDVKIMRNGRPSRRKTCSHACHHSIKAPRKPEWKKEELEYLDQLALAMPIVSVYRTYNRWASQNGFERRTLNSIEHKVYREFGSTKPILNFFLFKEIADLLCISPWTVAFWKCLKNKPLEVYQRHKNKGTNYVSRKSFRQFALNHPEKLGGTNRRGLLVLLEDEKLVDDILKAHPKRNTSILPSQRVRCIETNKIYSSINEASRANFVARPTMTRAIKRGWRTNGYHFEFLNW